MKTLKTSSDCHMKRSRSLKGSAISKIPHKVLLRNLSSFCWLLKGETSKNKRFPVLRQKPSHILHLLKEVCVATDHFHSI